MVLSLSLQILSTLSICLTLSFFFNRILKKMDLPNMLAPLVVGLLLSFNLSKDMLKFVPEFSNIVEIFATLGIILTLFFLGLKLNFKSVKNLTKNSSIMAINAGFFPFILGFVITYMFNFNLLQSFFAGICLTLTAEEVSISILTELKLGRKKLGQIIMEAAAIGNVLEIIVIAILGIIIKSMKLNLGSNIYLEMGLEIIFFMLLITSMRYIIIPFLFSTLGENYRNYELFMACFVVLIILCVGSEFLNFGYIIGALIAGMLVKDHLGNTTGLEDLKVKNVIETVNFSVFEPMIFIWIGQLIDVNSLFNDPMLGIILAIVATFGKLIGSVVGNFLSKGTFSEAMVIGWGLNPRGATELFAVLIAKNTGVIGYEIFNAVVVMAIITTIISPIIFRILIKNNNRKKKVERSGETLSA